MKEHSIDYIDLLKVDIEGAEREVFESSRGWIDRVGAIVVELHDRFKVGCTDSVDAATRAFEVRHKRGELTFLRRLQDLETASPQPSSITEAADSYLGHVGVVLPLVIVHQSEARFDKN